MTIDKLSIFFEEQRGFFQEMSSRGNYDGYDDCHEEYMGSVSQSGKETEERS